MCYRFAQYIRAMNDPAELQQSQNVSMFLANQNIIRDTLKSKFQSFIACLNAQKPMGTSNIFIGLYTKRRLFGFNIRIDDLKC